MSSGSSGRSATESGCDCSSTSQRLVDTDFSLMSVRSSSSIRLSLSLVDAFDYTPLSDYRMWFSAGAVERRWHIVCCSTNDPLNNATVGQRKILWAAMPGRLTAAVLRAGSLSKQVPTLDYGIIRAKESSTGNSATLLSSQTAHPRCTCANVTA